MTTYLIAAAALGLAVAYAVTLVLVLRARTYWMFGVWIAGELLKIWADVMPVTADFYVTGAHLELMWQPEPWMALESVMVVLRALAVAEAWLWCTWSLHRRERLAAGAVGLAGGFGSAVLTMLRFPVEERWVYAYDQAWLSAHLVIAAVALVGALWVWQAGARYPKGALAHTAIWVGYLAVTIAYGLYEADSWAAWEAARAVVQCGWILALSLWAHQQFFQHGNAGSQLPHLRHE